MSRIRFDLQYYYHVSGKWSFEENYRNQISEIWNLSLSRLLALETFLGTKPIAYVLMNNHFHLLIRVSDNTFLSDINLYLTNSWEKDLLQVRAIENKEGFKTLFFKRIKNFAELKEAYKYIYRNPIEAKLVDKAESYPYSSLHTSLKKNLTLAMEDPFYLIFNEPRVLEWINNKDKPLYYTYESLCHDL